MATETVPAATPAPDLRINLNVPVGAEIRFSSTADLAEFAVAMSARVSNTLGLLTAVADQAEGTYLQTALEGATDCAYQVQQAIGLLTRKAAA